MGTRIRLIDFDEYFDPEKVVTNHEPMKSGEFTDDGVFSERIFGSEDEVNNIDNMGWIDFGKNTYIINPLIYKRLERLMRANVLDAIISFNMRINIDGKFEPMLDEDGNTIKSANIEDANVGLWEFKRNFIYYLNKYTPTGKKSLPEYRNILRWYLEDKVFINKLPIFSPKLRPAQIFSHDKTFQFSEINKYYNLAIKHSNNIKAIKGDDILEDIQLQKLRIQHRLQGYCNDIFDSLVDNIKGKSGVIRKNIMAGRVNWSNRSVIIPNPDLAVNEIIINYVTFINLYKIPLINLISLSE